MISGSNFFNRWTDSQDMEVVTRGGTFVKTDGEKEKGRKRNLKMMLFFGPQRGLQSDPWEVCVGGHITIGRHVEEYCMLDPSSSRTSV